MWRLGYARVVATLRSKDQPAEAVKHNVAGHDPTSESWEPATDNSHCLLQMSRKYGLARAPKLVEMIAAVPEEHRAVLLPQLRAKPVRTASGIAVVAVMSKPHRCPHIATTGRAR